MERIININGVYYVARVNEFGTYMERVNVDGSPWVDQKPALNDAEIASGITPRASAAPVAPAIVQIAPPPARRPWWKFWG